MNLVKVSSSGQITLPKAFRQKYTTPFYSYHISGNQLTVRPVSMQAFGQVNPEVKSSVRGKRGSLIKHLGKGIFKSKHPEIRNLSESIDETVHS